MEQLDAWDLGLLYKFTSFRSPWLNDTVLTLTHLGDAITLTLVVILSATLLWLVLKTPKLAGLMLFIGLLSLGIEWGVKNLVRRERPPTAAVRLAEPPDPHSFPSGHSFCSMAIYGTLGLLLYRATRRPWTRYMMLVGIAISLVVGLTRVIIGVHYPFDVLAGWTGGLLCLTVAYLLAGKLAPPPTEGVPAA